jgi:hypothetical protein
MTQYRVNVSGVAAPIYRTIRQARRIAREWSLTPGYHVRVTVTRLSDGATVAGYQDGCKLSYDTGTSRKEKIKGISERAPRAGDWVAYPEGWGGAVPVGIAATEDGAIEEVNRAEREGDIEDLDCVVTEQIVSMDDHGWAATSLGGRWDIGGQTITAGKE